MRKLISLVSVTLLALTWAAPASACGTTVAMIDAVANGAEPPLLRCGREFNEMLAAAGKKNWKQALTSYKAHLGNMGKWQANSAEAKEALAYLEKKAAGK